MFSWMVLAPAAEDPRAAHATVLAAIGKGGVEIVSEPMLLFGSGKPGEYDDAVHDVSLLNELVADQVSPVRLLAAVTLFLDSVRVGGPGGVNAIRRPPKRTPCAVTCAVLEPSGGWLVWHWQLAALARGAGVLGEAADQLADQWAGGSVTADRMLRRLRLPGRIHVHEVVAATALPSRRIHRMALPPYLFDLYRTPP
jgi:hypothetical protein